MAQTNLGASYLLGQGVQKDLVQAYMWCALAASAGHDKGKECLAYTANLMNADKIAEARRRAREWSKVAATPIDGTYVAANGGLVGDVSHRSNFHVATSCSKSRDVGDPKGALVDLVEAFDMGFEHGARQ